MMSMKGNYNFRVETSSFVEFIGTDYALQVNGWIQTLKTSMKCTQIARRTTRGKLTRNVKDLVDLFR